MRCSDCRSFTKGTEYCDLNRHGKDWEVKICKGTGLTNNQSKVIRGENYIVVNYRPDSTVRSIWVLWHAQDRYFTDRKANSNARTLDRTVAADAIDILSGADGSQG